MNRRPRLRVGQIWVCRMPVVPRTYWLFEMVHVCWHDGHPYYVALKIGVPPDSQQAVVFNPAGQTVNIGSCSAEEFHCIRVSRARKKEPRL